MLCGRSTQAFPSKDWEQVFSIFSFRGDSFGAKLTWFLNNKKSRLKGTCMFSFFPLFICDDVTVKRRWCPDELKLNFPGVFYRESNIIVHNEIIYHYFWRRLIFETISTPSKTKTKVTFHLQRPKKSFFSFIWLHWLQTFFRAFPRKIYSEIFQSTRVI